MCVHPRRTASVSRSKSCNTKPQRCVKCFSPQGNRMENFKLLESSSNSIRSFLRIVRPTRRSSPTPNPLRVCVRCGCTVESGEDHICCLKARIASDASIQGARSVHYTPMATLPNAGTFRRVYLSACAPELAKKNHNVYIFGVKLVWCQRRF